MKRRRIEDTGPLACILVLAALVFIGAAILQWAKSERKKRVVQVSLPLGSLPEVAIYRI